MTEENELIENVEVMQDFDVSRYKELDKDLKKKFGEDYKGYNDKKVFDPVEFTPIECLGINKMLGGGICEGRIIEIFGPSSVGNIIAV